MRRSRPDRSPGSVSAAAKELSLTQSAVSRQIKALEEQLQVELFVRDRQTLRPSSAATSFLAEVRDALYRISTASHNLYANPNGGILNVTILSSFGTRWLAPRLSHFKRLHPGITVNLKTRFSLFDFRDEGVDAAIHSGVPYWPGAEMVELRREFLVAACSRDYRASSGIKTPADLVECAADPHGLDGPVDRLGEVVHRTRPEPGRVSAGSFDQFSTVARAAATGLGVGLLPDFLIEDELSSGRLVPAVDVAYENADKYYLAWPEGRKDYPPLVAFRSGSSRSSASLIVSDISQIRRGPRRLEDEPRAAGRGGRVT